jgi:hypothetical protein
LGLPAAFNPGQAMLGDFGAGLQQVEYLTALKDAVCLVGTELTTTAPKRRRNSAFSALSTFKDWKSLGNAVIRPGLGGYGGGK